MMLRTLRIAAALQMLAAVSAMTHNGLRPSVSNFLSPMARACHTTSRAQTRGGLSLKGGMASNEEPLFDDRKALKGAAIAIALYGVFLFPELPTGPAMDFTGKTYPGTAEMFLGEPTTELYNKMCRYVGLAYFALASALVGISECQDQTLITNTNWGFAAMIMGATLLNAFHGVTAVSGSYVVGPVLALISAAAASKFSL